MNTKRMFKLKLLLTYFACLVSATINTAQATELEALIAVQQAYIKASNTDGLDYFANSLSISGDTLVVGAHLEDSDSTGINGDDNNLATDSGAVYVYSRVNGSWIFDAYLKSSNSEAGDNFGFSVAISQDTIVVGARGEDSDSTLVGGDQSNNIASGSGAAYVFSKINDNWEQTAYLKASNTEGSDSFGSKVAIDGDYIAIGAKREDSNAIEVGGNQTNNDAPSSGAVYLYKRVAGVWQFDSYIKASNTGEDDEFGNSLSLSADTLVVGASKEDSNSQGIGGNQLNNDDPSTGAVYVYQLINGSWEFQEYLKASNSNRDDKFGGSVDIINDTIVVGANGEESNAIGVNGNEGDNSLNGSGAAYVFTRSNDNIWSQQAYLKASNTENLDLFGSAVSIGYNLIAITARWESSSSIGVNGDQNNNDIFRSGAAFIFAFKDNIWQQQIYLKPSNTDDSDNFGRVVSLSNNTVVIGTRSEDSNGTGIDGIDNNLADSSGAAYAFTNINEFVFGDGFE